MGGAMEGKEVLQESTGKQEQQPEQSKEQNLCQPYDRDHSMTLQDKRGDSIVSYSSLELSEESGGLELLGLRRGLEGSAERQSSIDTEPHTLDITLIRDAKVNISGTYLKPGREGGKCYKREFLLGREGDIWNRQEAVDTRVKHVSAISEVVEVLLASDQCKNAAVDVLETYEADEALHLFLKRVRQFATYSAGGVRKFWEEDAEDDQIRQVAIAIIQEKNVDL